MPRRPVDFCFRGHRISGANHKVKHRGKACRACECALSQAHNMWRRKGEFWLEQHVQAYADFKYEEFRGEGL